MVLLKIESSCISFPELSAICCNRIVMFLIKSVSMLSDGAVGLATFYDIFKRRRRLHMKLINCTPHPINIYNKQNDILVIQPSGLIPRISTVETLAGSIKLNDTWDIPLYVSHTGPCTDVPEPNGNHVYIVSQLVASEINRKDLVYPNDIIRDNNGDILGCKSLAYKDRGGIM